MPEGWDASVLGRNRRGDTTPETTARVRTTTTRAIDNARRNRIRDDDDETFS